jgi:hypothetical protein
MSEKQKMVSEWLKQKRMFQERARLFSFSLQLEGSKGISPVDFCIPVVTVN